jgi:prophage maintenance system killer protein
LLTGGEERLNQYRDELREVANELGMDEEFAKINSIISALLSTHDANVLSTDSAKATAAGSPFDATRVELFELLFDAIKDKYFVIRNNRNADEESFRLFSFFESYFSNYIEGTEFDIDEAKAIVDSGIPMPRRDEDSHDILGTFKILSNRTEMMRTPASPNELFAILSHRHSVLLAGRPHMNPGIFKTKNNRAGQTEFVDHQLVKGTLSQGFKYYAALTDPFARALFMMFMISEVHPFNDGNGRMARVMMNAEFVKADQSRIIVPTVFREDYILSLRKLTRHKDPSAYINVMNKLHQFSDNLYGSDFTELKHYLAACNAYEEPSQAKLQIIDRTIK